MDPKWKPVGSVGGAIRKWETPGQECEGLWRGMHDGRFGPLGTLEGPDGIRYSFPLHTALLDRVKQVKEGAELLIRYTGKQVSKAGREFKAFEVYVSNADDVRTDEGPDGDVPF